MNDFNEQPHAGEVWEARSELQTVGCFICEEDFTCLYPREILGEYVCPDCQNKDRDELLSELVEEKTARLQAERLIKRQMAIKGGL